MYLTESPRIAMQSLRDFVPTIKKIDYINALMRVNFSVLDCGGFTSPEMDFQIWDTAEVLRNTEKTDTKISVVATSLQGVEYALKCPTVDILEYTLSIYDIENNSKKRDEILEEVREINTIVNLEKKKLNICLLDFYDKNNLQDEVFFIIKNFGEIGVQNILLADTTSSASVEKIRKTFRESVNMFPEIRFGAHFYTKNNGAYEKLKTAFDEGCRDFHSTIKGIGGMSTEKLINFLATEKVEHSLNLLHYEYAYNQAKNIFGF